MTDDNLKMRSWVMPEVNSHESGGKEDRLHAL